MKKKTYEEMMKESWIEKLEKEDPSLSAEEADAKAEKTLGEWRAWIGETEYAAEKELYEKMLEEDVSDVEDEADDEKVIVNVRVPASTRDAWKRYADEVNVSVSELIRQGMELRTRYAFARGLITWNILAESEWEENGGGNLGKVLAGLEEIKTRLEAVEKKLQGD